MILMIAKVWHFINNRVNSSLGNPLFYCIDDVWQINPPLDYLPIMGDVEQGNIWENCKELTISRKRDQHLASLFYTESAINKQNP